MIRLQLMAHASRWLQSEGFGTGGLTTDVVEWFRAQPRAAGYTNYVTARAMAALLGYLRGIGGTAPAAAAAAVACGDVEVLLAGYRNNLAVERGLTADTMRGRARGAAVLGRSHPWVSSGVLTGTGRSSTRRSRAPLALRPQAARLVRET
jgi:hypothetical protein